METTHEQTTTDPHTDYADASIKRVTAENGIEYAYRDLGDGDVPLVLLQHFRGNLDNWDPALDRRARRRSTRGHVRQRRRRRHDRHDAEHGRGDGPRRDRLHRGDGLPAVDLLGFSIGSFVAQEIALIRPDLLRRVVLASSAPQGAAGMHGWAPEVIDAVGAAGTEPAGIPRRSSSPPPTRVAKPGSRPPGASSGGRPTGTSRRRGRPARRSTTPSARGASPTTRCSSGSPRSTCRCSSPTATATR